MVKDKPVRKCTSVDPYMNQTSVSYTFMSLWDNNEHSQYNYTQVQCGCSLTSDKKVTFAI